MKYDSHHTSHSEQAVLRLEVPAQSRESIENSSCNCPVLRHSAQCYWMGEVCCRSSSTWPRGDCCVELRKGATARASSDRSPKRPTATRMPETSLGFPLIMQA